MTFELPKRVNVIPSPFLVACGGYSDLRLIDALLVHRKITNCNVGCHSRDFAADFPAYLGAIKGILDLQAKPLQGILVVVDADTSRRSAFHAACEALRQAEFPVPSKPFEIEDRNPRVAVYIIPGIKRNGTLEHLLLEAAYKKNPNAEECTDRFFRCVRKVRCSSNKAAKMRMSALVGATCSHNPWASATLMWSDKRNPVPINSPCFKHLSDFLFKFSA